MFILFSLFYKGYAVILPLAGSAWQELKMSYPQHFYKKTIVAIKSTTAAQ